MDVELDYQYSCRKWSIKPVDTEEVVGDFIRITKETTDNVKNKVSHKLNIRYGEGEKQLYDLYGTDLPPESGLVVFIHGGYWQALSKDSSASIVEPLYKEGFKVLIAGYDLAPKAKLHEIVKEIQDLARQLLELAIKDKSAGVWFVGHSAGAHLSSTFLSTSFQSSLSEEQKKVLRGLVLISGIYELTPLLPTHINELLNLTASDALEMSTHNLFSNSYGCKILLTVAIHESPEFHRQSTEAHEKAIKGGNSSELIIPRDIDHFTIIEDLCNPSFELTEKIISFIKS